MNVLIFIWATLWLNWSGK